LCTHIYSSFHHFILLILFLITIINSIIYGLGKNHEGFIILACALLFLVLTTGILAYWIQKGDLEVGVKRVVIVQSVALLIVCVAVVTIIYRPEACTCDPCVQECVIDGSESWFPSTSPCNATLGPLPQCFMQPACFPASRINNTICIWTT